MARGGVSSRPDAWAHPGGHRWKMCSGAAWPAGVLGQGGRASEQDRKMQLEGLRKGDGLGMIFRDKTQLYRKVYNGLPSPGRLGGAAGE